MRMYEARAQHNETCVPHLVFAGWLSQHTGEYITHKKKENQGIDRDVRVGGHLHGKLTFLIDIAPCQGPGLEYALHTHTCTHTLSHFLTHSLTLNVQNAPKKNSANTARAGQARQERDVERGADRWF